MTDHPPLAPLAPPFADHATVPDAARAQFADSFARLTEGAGHPDALGDRA